MKATHVQLALIIALVTGRQIRTMRTKLGLDPFALAGLLGVHVSTIYRWESLRTEVAADPIQRELLTAIAAKIQQDRKAAGAIQRATKVGLVNGGTLHALYRVLEIVLDRPTSTRGLRRSVSG